MDQGTSRSCSLFLQWVDTLIDFCFLKVMKQNGNLKSNAYYNPNEVRNPPPTNFVSAEGDSEMERYIRGQELLHSHALIHVDFTRQRNTSTEVTLKDPLRLA